MNNTGKHVRHRVAGGIIVAMFSVRAFADSTSVGQSSNVTLLRQQLIAANARCAQLTRENAALRQQLAALNAPSADAIVPASVAPPQPVGDEPTVVKLPPTPRLGGHAGPVLLASGVAGTSVKISFVGNMMSAVAASPTRVTLTVHRLGSGFGVDRGSSAGTLWVDKNQLWMQWADGSPAELEQLRYAVVSVGAGPTAQRFQFEAPVEVNVSLKKPAPVALPMDTFAQLQLAAVVLPDGWSTRPGPDTKLVKLANGDLNLEARLDTVKASLVEHLVGTAPDLDADRRHLQQVQAAEKRRDEMLEQMKEELSQPAKVTPGHYVGALYFPPVTEDKSGLQVQVMTVTEAKKNGDALEAKLQSQLDADTGRQQKLDTARQITLSLRLPNGAVAAHVKLG